MGDRALVLEEGCVEGVYIIILEEEEKKTMMANGLIRRFTSDLMEQDTCTCL